MDAYLPPPPPRYVTSVLKLRPRLPVLLAALVLAVMVGAGIFSPPVAEAQVSGPNLCDNDATAPELCHTYPRPAWSSKLHVRKYSSSGREWLGCFSGTLDVADPLVFCARSLPGKGVHITQNTGYFRFGGKSWSIWGLSKPVTGTGFVALISDHLPPELETYTLHAGGETLHLRDADIERVTTSGNTKFTWVRWRGSEYDLDWSEDDHVDVFLVPPVWAAELTVGEVQFGLGCGAPQTPTTSSADCSAGIAQADRTISYRGGAVNLEYVNLREPDGVFGGNSLRFAVNTVFANYHFMTLWVDGKPFRLEDAADYGCHHCNFISGVDRTGDLWDSGYDAVSGRGFHVFTWGDSGLSWAEGDKVLLSLEYTPLLWMESSTTRPDRVDLFPKYVRETLPSGSVEEARGEDNPDDPAGGYYSLPIWISHPAPPGGLRVDLVTDPASTATAGVDYEWLNSYDPFVPLDQQAKVTTTPYVFFEEGETYYHRVFLRIIDDAHEDSGETIIVKPVAEGFDSRGMVITILNHDTGPPPGETEAERVSLAAEKAAAEERERDRPKQPIPGKSDNADLATLSLPDMGVLHPAFDPDTTDYAIHLTEQQARYLSIFAEIRTEHAEATFAAPGKDFSAFNAGWFSLSTGYSFHEPVTFEVVVTAADAYTTKTYTLTTTTDPVPVPKPYSLSPAAGAVEGESAALTITLGEAAPAGGVEFTVSAGFGGGSTATSDDVGSITSPVAVAEGETALDIAIPIADDDVDEDDETFTVTVSAATAGWSMEGAGRDTATVTITDDDTAGVTVTPKTLNVAEDGSGTYSVVLDSRPTADVTVTPAISDDGAASFPSVSLDFTRDDRNVEQPGDDATGGDDGAVSFSPSSLTFTPSDWNVAQDFTVSGVADEDANDETVGISHDVASSDAKYEGIAVDSVEVSVDDTPEPERQVQEPQVELPGPVAGLLSEATADSVTVSWRAPESGGAPDNYIVHLKPAGGGKGKGKVHRPKAPKTSTTFRNLKGGATYKVWVRAQNAGGKGERAHADITLTDPETAEQQQEREPATFSVTAAARTAEGSDATLTVTLSEAAPAGGVELTVSAGYGGGGTATAEDVGSITSPVTVAEGETALDIAVPTADDDADEDDETFTVVIAAATGGWEKAGDGQDTATVTIVDDDTAGVTVTPTTLNVSEDGSGTYSVVLDSRPTADVTVMPAGSDDGAASVAPASYTFTPSNWSTPQTFTVSGAADEDTDNESVTISHRVAGTDAKYGGIAVDDVIVAVADTTPEPALCPEETEPPVPGQIEPYNVCVTPGDGTLTVTWTISPRPGTIKHALRWSQEAGVWANPRGSRSRNDGIVVEAGVASYTITGLQNGVATGVFVRSFVGNDSSERALHSSKWVRIKGENTTPRADE